MREDTQWLLDQALGRSNPDVRELLALYQQGLARGMSGSFLHVVPVKRNDEDHSYWSDEAYWTANLRTILDRQPRARTAIEVLGSWVTQALSDFLTARSADGTLEWWPYSHNHLYHWLLSRPVGARSEDAAELALDGLSEAAWDYLRRRIAPTMKRLCENEDKRRVFREAFALAGLAPQDAPLALWKQALLDFCAYLRTKSLATGRYRPEISPFTYWIETWGLASWQRDLRRKESRDPRQVGSTDDDESNDDLEFTRRVGEGEPLDGVFEKAVKRHQWREIRLEIDRAVTDWWLTEREGEAFRTYMVARELFGTLHPSGEPLEPADPATRMFGLTLWPPSSESGASKREGQTSQMRPGRKTQENRLRAVECRFGLFWTLRSKPEPRADVRESLIWLGCELPDEPDDRTVAALAWDKLVSDMEEFTSCAQTREADFRLKNPPANWGIPGQKQHGCRTSRNSPGPTPSNSPPVVVGYF